MCFCLRYKTLFSEKCSLCHMLLWIITNRLIYVSKPQFLFCQVKVMALAPPPVACLFLGQSPMDGGTVLRCCYRMQLFIIGAWWCFTAAVKRCCLLLAPIRSWWTLARLLYLKREWSCMPTHFLLSLNTMVNVLLWNQGRVHPEWLLNSTGIREVVLKALAK